MFEVRDGNNNENLHGSVSGTDAESITVNALSITDIHELNMPTRGSLDVNNKEYTYNSFSYNTNDKGVIESVTFYLNQTLTVEEQGNLMSKALQVGDDVDFMGIPYYQNQMNLFLRNFCGAFNKIEIGEGDDTARTRGVDLNGDLMNAFFVARDKVDLSVEHQMRDDVAAATIYSAKDVDDDTKKYESYYLLTAKNVTIAKDTDKDSAKFATTTLGNYTDGVDAAHLVEELQKLQNKTKLFRGGGGDSFLQCIYSDVTVDTQECKIFTKNFTNIKTTISEQRMSVSGVDEDEEALDLIKFQNAYNLASKCISVFSEIYDRLILQTGV